MEMRFTPRAHRFCLWFGPALSVIYMIGFIFLAKFMPVPTPGWTPRHFANWMANHHAAYQIGCLMMIAATGMFGPWGAAVSVWSRKTEARFPVLWISQIVCLAAGLTIFVIITIFWGVSSFRLGQVSPQINESIYDIGWFMFLFDISPFIMWAGSLALGILWNPPEHQLYPRWAGYFTLATCLCWSAGLLIIFFHSGPFSYNGILAMWLPLGLFYVWLIVMTVLGLRAVNKQEAICRQETEPGFGVWAPSLFDELDALDEQDGVSDLPAPAPGRTRVPVGGIAMLRKAQPSGGHGSVNA